MVCKGIGYTDAKADCLNLEKLKPGIHAHLDDIRVLDLLQRPQLRIRTRWNAVPSAAHADALDSHAVAGHVVHLSAQFTTPALQFDTAGRRISRQYGVFS